MNSALLLALNAVALAALVMFHVQSNNSDPAQLSQAVPHHLQQRPLLAVMTPNAQSPVRLAQDTQAAPASERWIF
ncbi:hypothetical protein BFW86_21710 [Pseudomonas fluorescens]|nr:hypothetical protein BFW86_21710 [Pseudomonas fluorescens]